MEKKYQYIVSGMQELLDKYFDATKFMARENTIFIWVMSSPFHPLLSDEIQNKPLFPDPELMALTGCQDFYIFFPISLLHQHVLNSRINMRTLISSDFSPFHALYSLHPLYSQTPEQGSTKPSILWSDLSPFLVLQNIIVKHNPQYHDQLLKTSILSKAFFPLCSDGLLVRSFRIVPLNS